MAGEKVQMPTEAAAPSLSPAPVEGKPREAAVGEKRKATEEPAPAESDLLSDASESAAAAATIADDGGKPASEAAVAEDELPYDEWKIQRRALLDRLWEETMSKVKLPDDPNLYYDYSDDPDGLLLDYDSETDIEMD
ncbi:Os11g0273500 [Oryza sativa Japonica Group]|uniref:Uncharacterized protein n=3 Tax=Oryza TaxID=4527 RepID=A0A8J8Y3C8_ORYSJ|nr:hypothetical protein LOC_Os11g17340 [Oryza sativa Japonica Group]ABA92734.1 hypothetical protein LOC_Os11g17340 [Oryza sativa Japonica Group]EAZ18064.1 hypothetical protein OsJ_33609 [Oryza sativa Japonica Group]BAT13572.1 Os11g0273500 [Oryza sativa Japonica Group]